MFKQRLNRLQGELVKRSLDGIIITNKYNLAYVTGFYGTFGYAIITQNDAFLITDSRYIEEANKQAEHFKAIKLKDNLYEEINLIIQKYQIKTLGFEDLDISYYKYKQLVEKTNKVTLIPIGEIFNDFKKIKDSEEIIKIKNAIKIADRAFSHILKIVRPGITEKEIALEIEFYMKKQGASALSFDTVVVSGLRSSLPHGQPTNKKIKKGDIITLDFGCIFEGYCSDITRTIAVGTISKELKDIYNIVLQAQLKALENIRPGLLAKDIDKIARDVIASHGYANYFGHALGHGVGTEVHEQPRISPKNQEVLKPGMIITIEPGIYVEGLGGVRIEDMVLITEDSIENLTFSTKELLIL